jgi:hypothetical protein
MCTPLLHKVKEEYNRSDCGDIPHFFVKNLFVNPLLFE